MIRLGTAGIFQPHTKAGDLVIVTGAIRHEGTSTHYLPMDFPAVANLEIVNAMVEAARNCRFHILIGIAHSKDSFYGEVEPQRMPLAEDLQRRWQAWTQGNALASEMECATPFHCLQLP